MFQVINCGYRTFFFVFNIIILCLPTKTVKKRLFAYVLNNIVLRADFHITGYVRVFISVDEISYQGTCLCTDNNNNNLYCNGDTYHNSNLNIKLNGRGFYVFYKWQEHVQVM